MRKTLYLILALLMITSVAYGLELTQLETGQLAAFGKGRARVSDTSVILQVWYTGTGSGAIGVSGNTTLVLYSDYTADTVAYTINTAAAGYHTLAEVIDYINGTATDFSAKLGPDGYLQLDSFYMLPAYIALLPQYSNPLGIRLDSSTAGYLTCGVPLRDFATPRIRKTESQVFTDGGMVQAEIWEDTLVSPTTVVWTSNTNVSSYNDSSSPNASPNTVDFTMGGSTGGLAGTKNKSLVFKLTPTQNDMGDAVVTGASTPQEKAAAMSISILYDSFEGR